MKKIHLKVNGRGVQVIADEGLVLLDLLRDVLGLTGTKQSCDRKGQCGACTVIVNGKAVLSCLTQVAALNGANVITVEGPRNPGQSAPDSGGLCAGRCRPVRFLHAGNDHGRQSAAGPKSGPHPGRDKVRPSEKSLPVHGLHQNQSTPFCWRPVSSGATSTPEAIRPHGDDNALGINHPRPSAMIKACGTAQFTADIRIPGALELAALRSPPCPCQDPVRGRFPSPGTNRALWAP